MPENKVKLPLDDEEESHDYHFKKREEVAELIEIIKLLYSHDDVFIWGNDRSVRLAIRKNWLEERSSELNDFEIFASLNKKEKEKFIRKGVFILTDVFRRHLFETDKLHKPEKSVISKELDSYITEQLRKDEELRDILHESMFEDINIQIAPIEKRIADLGKSKYYELNIYHGSISERKASTFRVSKKQLKNLKETIEAILQFASENA